MADERDELLRQARDELYHARVLVRGLRNRTKTDAAALFDSEQRIEGLIAQIEARTNETPRQGGSGNVQHTEVLAHAHQ